uniref:Uncharacterized protein n=1 Tax=Bionectria ochroleuca TaxID=29856 RepID=A0A0B7KI51_BIOOC
MDTNTNSASSGGSDETSLSQIGSWTQGTRLQAVNIPRHGQPNHDANNQRPYSTPIKGNELSANDLGPQRGETSK